MRPILKSIYPYFFLFFCFVLPLDKYATAVPNIVLIALLIMFPFVVNKSDFKKLLRKEILIFTALLVYIALNSLIFGDFLRDQTIIKKIGSALLLIVLYIPLEKLENLKKTIIASVLICMLICLYNLYFYYMQEGAFNFSSGNAINEVLIIDRLYIGFLCVLSIIFSIGLIGEKYNEYNKWYFANIVFTIGFVLLISSRIAILLLLVLFFLKIFYAKRKKIYVFFFLGVAGLVFIAFLLNKNLNERFFYAHSAKQKSYVELFMEWEPRVVIWECNYDILQREDYLLTGLGFYVTKDLLVECYDEVIEKERRKKYFMSRRFNPHNQYVDFLMSAGILSTALFVWMFMVMLYRNRRSYFRASLIISLASLALIESYFHRQLGAYIFAMVLILVLFQTSKTHTKREDEGE